MKTVCLLLLFILIQFTGCIIPEYPNAEITSNMDLVPIEDYSAKIKTTLTDNGDEILTRGVCWSETPNPLIPNGFLTKDGASPGEFTSTLTDLKPSTRYYVRGYAITPLGIVYSNEISFTTAPKGFVFVKGGTFQMGNSNGEDDEQPVHTAVLDSFYMAKYEVTKELWINTVGFTPADTDTIDNDDPVFNVSWNQSIEFCNTLSLQDNLIPVYQIADDMSVTMDTSANGYRLPTESQWEYAARGGVLSQYNPNDGVYNILGLRNMSSHVWEYCWDWYAVYSTDAEPQTNPQGPSSGSSKVIRGAGWSQNPLYSERTSVGLDTRFNYIGFRVVRGI